MKRIIIVPLLALTFIGFTAADAEALSCLDPQSMIEYYVTTDDYVIFTAEAGETKEFVKEAADPDGFDPNMQFDRGYTGQFVTVTEAHKGYPDSMQWVYFEQNSTWGYLCAGGPAEVGEETLYIVSSLYGMFELPRVVNAYPADSQLALEIIEALEDRDTDDEPVVSEVTSTDMLNRIKSDLLEMAFLIKIKLSEFLFWQSK